jgi:hypothetical protein
MGVEYSWEKYPAIKNIFGAKWLDDPKNRDHPLFTLYNEINYIGTLNKYLTCIENIKKRTVSQLKNGDQLFDVYYELEIAYFLRRFGLIPELHKKISGKETDIFLEEENLVIEIAHKHIHHKIVSQVPRFIPKSKVHDIAGVVDVTADFHMKRMQDYLEDKNEFQSVYPNVVCFCPDVLAGDCIDLEKLIENCKVTEKVGALTIWRWRKIQCFFENPCGKKLKLKTKKLESFFNLTQVL